MCTNIFIVVVVVAVVVEMAHSIFIPCRGSRSMNTHCIAYYFMIYVYVVVWLEIEVM